MKFDIMMGTDVLNKVTPSQIVQYLYEKANARRPEEKRYKSIDDYKGDILESLNAYEIHYSHYVDTWTDREFIFYLNHRGVIHIMFEYPTQADKEDFAI
ncbi:MAG: hypothetical protein ACOCXG_03175 [Nanoarchaeota archaeon]